jgi:hypothetical protein
MDDGKAERLEEELDADYDIAQSFRSRIIPKVVATSIYRDVMGDGPLFFEFVASINKTTLPRNYNQTNPIFGPSIMLLCKSELTVSFMSFIVAFWGSDCPC